MNFLEETLSVMRLNGVNSEDILWVGTEHQGRDGWESFKTLASKIEYDPNRGFSTEYLIFNDRESLRDSLDKTIPIINESLTIAGEHTKIIKGGDMVLKEKFLWFMKRRNTTSAHEWWEFTSTPIKPEEFIQFTRYSPEVIVEGSSKPVGLINDKYKEIY